ncbi:hexose transporter HXT2 [Cyberlindnera jadinii NRRL Y-1542]|uniref:MFS general substrate transporter n=1 Tax=Cyberlindnera jadinii (strain ATCC 18201 / CBS 1600 / BCRC 20928 / JCM 3617 / NBRC 0987 / NRRL Y-1542) TaxID=983966 RepID=A0A1E4RVT3_CYBJN|nr:MFS general substrate transporter [Cyberlindnera jadinii NRRL Y-1542]ODV71185.1 MFS general substrate transporter [Cyberlindnera jadinii NRRL Y-1542]
MEIKKEKIDVGITSKDVNASNVEVFLQGLSEQEVTANIESIIDEHPELGAKREILLRGALLANDGGDVLEDKEHMYSKEEIQSLEFEKKHSIRSQSWTMYLIALTASLAAVNFGHDESAVGGAQLSFFELFGVTDSNIQGLLNAAPYLSAGVLGSPAAIILDHWFGRRWIIFVSCIFGVGGSLWQAFTQSMGSMLAARLFLGIGMGLSSTAVPMLIAESSPARSRGAFLMLWQTFVAFGVMLGSIFNRAFVDVPGETSWRLMIGASFVTPVFVAILIPFVPESPRYLVARNREAEALTVLEKLRNGKLRGARDFYILYSSLKQSGKIEEIPTSDQIKLFFTDGRVQYAFLVSAFNMAMQQYCGVNILVGYTATILTDSGIDSVTAIAGSIGIGGGCFLATFFSSQCIDRFGRRKMLLLTFPGLAFCLFWLGVSLQIDETSQRLGSGLTSMYLFVVVFGLGIGPVYPLNVRAFGVALGMSINWILDFMAQSMTMSGGLYFYGSFVLVLSVEDH